MKPQYPDLLKRKVAKILHELPRGSSRRIAKALEVSERTLRHWKNSYPISKKPGRRAEPVSFKEKLKIAREWKRQEYPGSRPIIKATGLRARVVRDLIAQLKKKRRRRVRQFTKQNQVRIRVTKPNVFLVMDGATTTKGDDFIVYRDRGSLSVEAKQCFGNLNSSHTLEALRELKACGRLPLVFGTDNGSPFCAREVKNYLNEHKVVHLRSLPHTPTHNGSAENAVCEFKRALSHGRCPKQACAALNGYRRRRELGWRTSDQCQEKTPSPHSAREDFFKAVQAAQKTIMVGTKTESAIRQAEREAIFQTLERFSFITRTRGGLPLGAKPEVNT